MAAVPEVPLTVGSGSCLSPPLSVPPGRTELCPVPSRWRRFRAGAVGDPGLSSRFNPFPALRGPCCSSSLSPSSPNPAAESSGPPSPAPMPPGVTGTEQAPPSVPPFPGRPNRLCPQPQGPTWAVFVFLIPAAGTNIVQGFSGTTCPELWPLLRHSRIPARPGQPRGCFALLAAPRDVARVTQRRAPLTCAQVLLTQRFYLSAAAAEGLSPIKPGR